MSLIRRRLTRILIGSDGWVRAPQVTFSVTDLVTLSVTDLAVIGENLFP